MISGGGAGRRYRPKANATIAMMATSTMGFARLLPSRAAQSSQRAPRSHLSRPLCASLAPQLLQKFERLMWECPEAGGLYFEWVTAQVFFETACARKLVRRPIDSHSHLLR